jgi:ABC-type dipeptide/oligopeptide/nickel transport system permease subunit
MAAQRSIGVIVVVVVAGLVVGSLLGELLGGLTSGWVQELFTKGPSIGLTSPATLDLRFLAVTFGLVFKVNVVGVLGIVIAALVLRRL